MNSTAINSENLSPLLTDLKSGSLKKQIKAIQALAKQSAEGEHALVDFLKQYLQLSQNAASSANSTSSEDISEAASLKSQPTAAHGAALQQLILIDTTSAQQFVSASFSQGLVASPVSEQNVDYSELQQLLMQQKYQAADKLTTQKLCELAGEQAVKRKWVYFTEVAQISAVDLQTIDRLWRIYSEDKFGWSRQHELWTRLGKDWDRLWDQLVWRTEDGAWTRYPGEFIWDLTAPIGHLPLSNQLRGVRTMDSLLSHPAWNQ